ncbi:MAG: hypothetical protein J6G98_02685 [Bacilli bacterium]|nr:hypothetical protein [Bacilli bacterium]
MDENLEMLEYIVKNSEMGVYSSNKLIKMLSDKENKIRKVVEGILKGYENYYKESKKLIKKYTDDIKENGTMAKMNASMMMKMDVMKDNSDANIAHILTQGLTMGVVDITSKIDRFKGDADKKIINMAKDYLKFQQESIDFLKDYL